MFWRALCLCCLLCASLAFANEEEALNFASNAQAQQYEALLKEFRCVTCPNQSLADSSMPIAMGMKAQIYEQVRDNKSSSEIKNYFVARYGKNVLYKPPYDRTTYLLWLGPFFLFVALVIVWRRQFKSSSVHG